MLPLNKKEILRYLGFKKKQELTETIDNEINQLMEEVQLIAHPRYTYLIFECQAKAAEQEIHVLGTDLILTGHSIYQHLKHAKKVALLAATLGIEVERRIRYYSLTEMSKSVILDACCTEYIEKICDLAECQIEKEAEKEGFTMNRRFSPGYGDLPLAIQPAFLAVLEADRRIGLQLSETLLMMPRKSVTAIIGLFDDCQSARPKRKKNNCADCSMNQSCQYKRS